jgi:hypothetical protein
MRVIAFDSGRVTVLFPIEEVMPLGGMIALDTVNDVIARYNFAKRPDLGLSREELQKLGLKFENGHYNVQGQMAPIVSFVIFPDGVVIDASKTDDAEAFWDDLSKWMISEKKFRDFTIAPTKRFVSQVVTEFDTPLCKLINGFDDLTRLVSEKLNAIYDAQIKLGFARVDFEFDRLSGKSSLIIPRFIIDRRVNIEFSRERYYCSAPLRTKDHVEVLQQIESAII